MSGSFHLSFFVFRQLWRRSYENQLSLSGKDSAADFFVFGHFDQNTKNEKWNEPDISKKFKLSKNICILQKMWFQIDILQQKK